MTNQKPPFPPIKLTAEQKDAMASRTIGLGISLALFAFIIYLASFAHLIG